MQMKDTIKIIGKKKSERNNYAANDKIEKHRDRKVKWKKGEERKKWTHETRVGGGRDGKSLIGVVILREDICESEIRI